jgi:hypothetical protein
MPSERAKNGESAGVSVDVEELFRLLREEVRRCGGDPGADQARSGVSPSRSRRLWPVSADRPPAPSGFPGGLGAGRASGKPCAGTSSRSRADQRSFTPPRPADRRSPAERLRAEVAALRAERPQGRSVAPQVPLPEGTGSSRTVCRRAPRAITEGRPVSAPFGAVSGARVLTQAFLWRMFDLDEVDGERIDAVVAWKFPRISSAIPTSVWLVHQFRQAYGSTAPSRLPGAHRGRALRRKCRRSDRIALGEASRSRPAMSPVGSRRQLARAEVLSQRRRRSTSVRGMATRAPVNRLDRANGSTFSSKLPRSIPTSRSSLRATARPRGGWRGSLEIAASTGEHASRVECPRRLADLYAAASRLYAPWTRTMEWSPEAFLSAVSQAPDDRRSGLRSSRTEAPAWSFARSPGWPELRAGSGEHRDDAATFGRAGQAVAAEVTRDQKRSGGCRRESRISNHRRPASGVADYSALLLPALGELLDVWSARAQASAARNGCFALPCRETTPRPRLIVDALRRQPGVVVLRLRAFHHLWSLG